jgi:hypothetical protein
MQKDFKIEQDALVKLWFPRPNHWHRQTDRAKMTWPRIFDSPVHNTYTSFHYSAKVWYIIYLQIMSSRQTVRFDWLIDFWCFNANFTNISENTQLVLGPIQIIQDIIIKLTNSKIKKTKWRMQKDFKIEQEAPVKLWFKELEHGLKPNSQISQYIIPTQVSTIQPRYDILYIYKSCPVDRQ